MTRTIGMVVGTLLAAPAGLLHAQTAFKSGEVTTGTTRQCFYRFGVSVYTRTVNLSELCPLSIQVDRSSRDLSRDSSPAKPWATLGQGLRDLGARLQAQREQEQASSEAARRWQLDSALAWQQLEVERQRLALAQRSASIDPSSVTELSAALVRALLLEFTTTPEYHDAVQAAEPDTVVAARAGAYIAQRWVELLSAGLSEPLDSSSVQPDSVNGEWHLDEMPNADTHGALSITQSGQHLVATLTATSLCNRSPASWEESLVGTVRGSVVTLKGTSVRQTTGKSCEWALDSFVGTAASDGSNISGQNTDQAGRTAVWVFKR